MRGKDLHREAIVYTEVVSSDDRSPDVFRKLLESSTEMKSVLSAGNKPNCVVIDEIDGAPTVWLLDNGSINNYYYLC